MACRFYNEYLGRIKLNDVFVDFTKKDMHYLMKESYDAAWIEAIGQGDNGDDADGRSCERAGRLQDSVQVRARREVHAVREIPAAS